VSQDIEDSGRGAIGVAAGLVSVGPGRSRDVENPAGYHGCHCREAPGERGGPQLRGRPVLRITDLAAIQGVAQPSITEMVAILERAGYVERHRDPLDGRASLAALTAAGRDCLRDRRRIASQSLAQLVAMLPAAERAALNVAVPALVHLRELDGGAVRSADAGHGQL
jgi:DNA-binding MarR family transcriptional regulator